MTMVESAPTETTLTGAQILANAKALVPILRKRAVEIEKNRQLPADVVQMLRDAGVFRIGFTRAWGGPEMTSMQQTEVIETLAYGEPSVGWCAKLGSDIGLHANFIEQDEARRMFALDMHSACVLMPTGRAEKVEGGFRLTGRWPFGSSSNHADWIGGGAFVFENGEPYASPDGSNPHESRLFFVPKDEVENIDNWDMWGMRGTGSSDFVINDVFVPESHSWTFDSPKIPNGPFSQADIIQRSMPGVAIGLARAALDHAREVIATKVNHITGLRWGEMEKFQIGIAETEVDYYNTRAGLYAAMERQWELTRDGIGTLDDLNPEERIAVSMTGWEAFQMARRVTRRLADLMGTAAVRAEDPLGRWFRDAHTMCQHLVAGDRVTQTAGAYLFDAKLSMRFMLGVTDASTRTS
jgi:alkylation response protein AidB-like acyl-CoA dehydrogenase